MASELKYWLALQKLPGLGPSRIRTLYEKFNPISNLWKAERKDLLDIEGVGPALADSILEGIKGRSLDEESPFIPEGVEAVTFSDREYPKALFNIYDPPSVIYKKGLAFSSFRGCVAVVGTRKPTFYGQQITESLVRGLVESGITIVSGLAAGIDTCAHRAALKYGGNTIAVLPGGFEHVYPYFNRSLSYQIVENGCLVSEFHPGRRFEKWDFPRRNRIISGLSLGVVVIEGASDSGSLITAGCAVDQNREVFAVPGQVFSGMSAGPNRLIKQGAKLVQTVDDILDELPSSVKCAQKKISDIVNGLNDEEKEVLSILSEGPRHIDFISSSCEKPVGPLSSCLLSMQLKGMIKELPGNNYSSNV